MLTVEENLTLIYYICLRSANDRGVRDPRGSAGGGAGGDPRQAEHLLQGVRSQAAGGRCAEPALYDHGGTRERAGAAGTTYITAAHSLMMRSRLKPIIHLQ